MRGYKGALPTDWKVSNVSPIYKKGDRIHAENYRQVHLTNVICKLFESIIQDTGSSFGREVIHC